MFGSSRNTGAPGYALRTSACGVRASIETTTFVAPADLPRHLGELGRLVGEDHDDRRARRAPVGLDGLAAELRRQRRRAARAGVGAQHGIAPAARERPRHVPAPMKPTCMAAGRESQDWLKKPFSISARALLRGDLDVARREQEHLVGDPLHAAVERVGEAGGEVDQALGEVGVGALQVDDHRDRVLELVRDVLGVVERLGDHEMHADVSPPPLPLPGGATERSVEVRRSRRRVVGEDVVDLVAAAARGQAAHVRALAVAALELLLGLADSIGLLFVRSRGPRRGRSRRATLCAGVAEGHGGFGRSRRSGGFPAQRPVYA